MRCIRTSGGQKGARWLKRGNVSQGRRSASGSSTSREGSRRFPPVLTDFVFKGLIFDVIVAPGHRDRGLGDEVVSLILNHEKLREVRSMELYCLPELVPFYERHGFGDDAGRLKLMRRPGR